GGGLPGGVPRGSSGHAGLHAGGARRGDPATAGGGPRLDRQERVSASHHGAVRQLERVVGERGPDEPRDDGIGVDADWGGDPRLAPRGGAGGPGGPRRGWVPG